MWSFCSIQAIFPTELFGHTLSPDGVGAQIIYMRPDFFYKKLAINRTLIQILLFLVSIKFIHLRADWELSVVISSSVVTAVVPDL